ncbi:hypothetical protein AB0L53_56980 [Nonomuraea sp. NPDC052129]|uniref:hypothetical protein n=1 Tax=Nonomuraea sp. NPDC052129 TaxID=3154651 RepID=UPI0034228539
MPVWDDLWHGAWRWWRQGWPGRAETGERWQAQGLNAATAAKVDQYVAAVKAFAASNTVILALADELAAGTINKTLAKSDLELGVETLAGALARQANSFPDASPVRVRHPLTAADTDETSWPWVTGLVVGMVAPGEWDIGGDR